MELLEHSFFRFSAAHNINLLHLEHGPMSTTQYRIFFQCSNWEPFILDGKTNAFVSHRINIITPSKTDFLTFDLLLINPVF